ncbi:MAG: S8 family serine peptidase [Kouleothrix sp.]
MGSSIWRSSFAAGNSGRDGVPGSEYGFCMGGNGVVDPDSLVSPGTAKNVITVGASVITHHRRLSGVDCILAAKNSAFLPTVFSDPVSDNADGMAAFSSRGPTDDGRIKPDLVAFGTNCHIRSLAYAHCWHAMGRIRRKLCLFWWYINVYAAGGGRRCAGAPVAGHARPYEP